MNNGPLLIKPDYVIAAYKPPLNIEQVRIVVTDGNRLILTDTLVRDVCTSLAIYTPNSDQLILEPLETIYMKDLRPATDEEEQVFWRMLFDHGWRWNEERGELEKRPRCGGDTYYYVASCGEVREAFDHKMWIDEMRYADRNYFFSKRVASKEAERVKDALRNGGYF